MKMFEKDAVPGRDDACGLRATGLHSVPCGTGARPRVNLTRYHDVLAQNHRWRAEVSPVGLAHVRGKVSAAAFSRRCAQPGANWSHTGGLGGTSILHAIEFEPNPTCISTEANLGGLRVGHIFESLIEAMVAAGSTTQAICSSFVCQLAKILECTARPTASPTNGPT